MSKLLIQESPMMIIPSLAVKIGLNESVVLQQIHYWLSTSSHMVKGRKWIYNTYQQWQKQFPFWSESTIKRTIQSLEKKGLLISENWNASKMDKTKWYTIDYEKLNSLENQGNEPSSAHIDLEMGSECPDVDAKLTKAIPENTTEITAEKNIPFFEIVTYLNEKTNSSYKPTTSQTKDAIRARWQEGFTLKDFKKVIDNKTAEWLHNPKMNKYLRPETLFGTKFESYLNQKSFQRNYREEDFDLDD